MHTLAQQLLNKIRKHHSLRAGDRVAAAVSGGADSVALLNLLLDLRAELGIVPSIAHVNHQLRGVESEEDQRFVEQLAQRHSLEIHIHIDTAPITRSSGIEAHARELRYNFFRQLAQDGRVTKIATAHTQDDQAETLLLRIFRGAGIRGLSSIHPRIIFEENGNTFGEVVRPLLTFRHEELQKFLKERGQAWREDSTNRDITFLRNRIRHRLLPIIKEEFGESAIEHMGELAEIARAEEDHWVSAHPEIEPFKADCSSLAVDPLLAISLASRRRVVRAWLQENAADVRISFRVINEVLDLAGDEAASGKQLGLSSGQTLIRERQSLKVRPVKVRSSQAALDYEYQLTIPGSVAIAELNACIEAKFVDVLSVPDSARNQLLDISKLPKEILIRNWRAGDRYWPARTATPKKVKELLTDRHAASDGKKLWPVAVAEAQGLIWMRDFAVPSALVAPEGAPKAVWIRQRQPSGQS